MKIAGVQMNVSLGNVQHNLARIAEFVRETRSQGAHLTVFPECAVTGYCFESLDEARPHAQPIPGPATELLRKACAEFSGWVVVGMTQPVVHGGEVEVHFAGELGLELLDLQINDNVAAQPQVVKEQVEVVVLPGDFQRILAAD